MRSHAKIIADAEGPAAVQEICRAESIHTVRSWAQRNSIPPEHWSALVARGLTTLEELTRGAEQAAEERRVKRAGRAPAQGQAAA